jgi:hypothetical protein
MGEAKRRIASDPSYGRPKRGLVVSPPIEITGSSLFVRTSNLDPQELRFALLFWDRLVWPSSRALHFSSGPDEQFLERASILTRPEYTFWGDGAQATANGQIQAFLDLDHREPGQWSLAQGDNSLLIKDRVLESGKGIAIELHRAIPVPDKDVPLDDILEFKRKRNDELQLLRSELDTLVAAVDRASDITAELKKHIATVDAACTDALRVGKEWRFPVRLANLKISLDLRPFPSIAAGLVGWEAGKIFGLPTATALLFSAGASLKLGGDFGLRSIRPRQGPYRYVYQFHSELF